MNDYNKGRLSVLLAIKRIYDDNKYPEYLEKDISEYLEKELSNEEVDTIEDKIFFNNAFQLKLWEIIEACRDNNTDSCTLSIDYTIATLEVELNFKLIEKEYKDKVEQNDQN